MSIGAGRTDLVASELVAVVVAVTPRGAEVLTVGAPQGVPRLPSGPLHAEHRSLQTSLRTWVERQTGVALGYVEQLYTFADRERVGPHHRLLSVSYLGLTRVDAADTRRVDGADARRVDGADARRVEDADDRRRVEGPESHRVQNAHPRELDEPVRRVHDVRPGGLGFAWRPWSEFLPWEDRRDATSRALAEDLRGRLLGWADTGATDEVRTDRRSRVDAAFGAHWVSEFALQRYQLLHEAGLTVESGAQATAAAGTGARMLHDHRRILATGVDRLRAKIQYRPVVFELVPPEFTLGRLQSCVEDIAGTTLHTQNFRRLVQQQHLVEETGGRESATGGRPAKLYRFRREVELERYAAGTKLPLSRGY